MITELTPEQIAKFPEYVKRWTDIGLCTEPANRPLAEEGIREAYTLAGLTAPEQIIWCTSPLAMVMAHSIVLSINAILSVRDSVGASVRDSIRASVGASVTDSVWASVGDSVWDSVWASVRDSVGDSVGASVRDSVWDSVTDSVTDSVGDSVWDSVWASVRASVGASVRDSVYGQHDANWLGFYDFFHTELGLTLQTAKLSGLWKIAKSANWWLPCENICFVCERHNELHRDEQGRLHNTIGIACGYPDGWGAYAYHGVRVDERIIKREFTFEDIQKEDNSEVKRVMIELYGEDNYIQHLGATPYSQDVWGELYRIEYGDSEPLCMVKVVCPSTGRVYYNQVPPRDDSGQLMARPKQAIAWRFGLTEAEYLPLKES